MTSSPSPLQKFVGALFMAVGLAMAAMCGLCGSAFVLGGLWSAITSHNHDGLGLSGLGLLMGGIPAALGVGLFLLGRNLRRS